MQKEELHYVEGRSIQTNSGAGSGAQRTARWRDRRRRGFRVYQIEVCAADLDGLVARGLLDRTARHDPNAVERAIGKLLERLSG